MKDFKSLHEGYVLAQRFGDPVAAKSYLQEIEQMLGTSLDSIPPRDVARFRLTRVERLLYEPPPGGFTEALTELDELKKLSPSIDREPSYYVFRAAALGQKYAHEWASGVVAPQTVRDAVEAIRQARYAGQTDWLQYLADPKRGAREATQDDDLLIIAREEPEVQHALGMS